MTRQHSQDLAKRIGGAGPEGEGDDQVETEELDGRVLSVAVFLSFLFLKRAGRETKTYHGALEVVGLAVLDGVGDDQHGEGEGDGFDWVGC